MRPAHPHLAKLYDTDPRYRAFFESGVTPHPEDPALAPPCCGEKGPLPVVAPVAGKASPLRPKAPKAG